MNKAASAPDARSLFRQLRPFWILESGELISWLGSTLALFALEIWVYEQTRSVTLFASVHLLGALPGVFLSPFAGVWIDRWNRRKVMIACNVAQAILTTVLAGLAHTNRLSTAVIFVVSPLFSTLATFMVLAANAATAQLVPAEHLPRMNGIVGTVESLGSIGIRVAAGFILVGLGVGGVLLVDAVTTLVAIATALTITLPDPPRSHPVNARPSMVREACESFTFVRKRPGLWSMLLVGLGCDFVARTATILSTPLVLSTSSPEALGIVRGSVMGGVLCGSMLLGAFGGSRKKNVQAILLAWALYGMCIVFAGFKVGIVGLCICVFGCGMCEPIAMSLNTAIWQSKVPNEMIGRVFSLRQTTSSAMFVVVLLVTGPLSDRFFEPAMQETGWLAPVLGPLLGTGAGRGIGLFLVVLGTMQLITIGFAARNQRLRRIETELPDAESAVTA